eukprot:5837830-Prymnesium_polylepis.1
MSRRYAGPSLSAATRPLPARSPAASRSMARANSTESAAVQRRDDGERTGRRGRHDGGQQRRTSRAAAQLIHRGCHGARHHKEEARARGHTVRGHVGRWRREADDGVEDESRCDADACTDRPALRLERVQRRHGRLDEKGGDGANERDRARDRRHHGAKEARGREEEAIGEVLERLHHEDART